MEPKKIISIILPVYNEQDNIPVVYNALLKEFDALGTFYKYELIFVDDGSRDRSWEKLKIIAAGDARVRALSFSRNFGHQIALKAGYDIAVGDAIITMDADMQHPPQLIPAMIQKWHAGFDIVYAKKVGRKDNVIKRSFAFLFYTLLDFISFVAMPHNVSDFRLIDKKVLSVLRRCKEQSPYLRGMVAWSGFKATFIECHYAKRHMGTTGYTIAKMFKLAWDGATGFSTFPLKVAAYIGALIIMIATVIGCALLYHVVIYGAHFSLVTWLVEALVYMVGVQFLMLWLLGEYVGRIHEQQKERPLYIVAQKIDNVSATKSARMQQNKIVSVKKFSLDQEERVL